MNRTFLSFKILTKNVSFGILKSPILVDVIKILNLAFILLRWEYSRPVLVTLTLTEGTYEKNYVSRSSECRQISVTCFQSQIPHFLCYREFQWWNNSNSNVFENLFCFCFNFFLLVKKSNNNGVYCFTLYVLYNTEITSYSNEFYLFVNSTRKRYNPMT